MKTVRTLERLHRWTCLYVPSLVTYASDFSMLGNFSCFCCRLLNFSKLNFKKTFQENYQSVSLDLDQGPVWLSADDKIAASKERVQIQNLKGTGDNKEG